MYYRELDQVLKTIRRLPVSPVFGELLLALDGNDHAQLRIGHKLIRKDPLLAMHLLRTANLAGLPHDQRCVTISSATHYLGSSLAMGAVQQACRTCQNDKLTVDWLEEENRLREHAVCVAIASQVFARHRMPGVPRELAYTAGLLHDCGKLMVLYNQVRRMPGQPVVEPKLQIDREHEEERCGFDHSMAGAWLCAEWALPSMIQQACLYHHIPDRAATPYQPIVRCIYFGNLLAHLCGTSSVSGAKAAAHLNDHERGRLEDMVEEVHLLFGECTKQTKELMKYDPPFLVEMATEFAESDSACDTDLDQQEIDARANPYADLAARRSLFDNEELPKTDSSQEDDDTASE